MQLALTMNELKMITRVLEKCLAQSQGPAFEHKRQIAGRLLDKMIDRDFALSADELEDLSDILAICKVEIKERIMAEPDPVAKVTLQNQQTILEYAADKVTEACMML
jgi:hypothetical protein